MVVAVVEFRPLRRVDFPLLGDWLAEPLVARWWNHQSSTEAVERDFGPSVDGRDATEMLLATVAGRAFGLIQRYPISAYPEYLAELTELCAVPPGALSIDYLIGDPRMRGRGMGAAMIAALVAQSWTGDSSNAVGNHGVVRPPSRSRGCHWSPCSRCGGLGWNAGW